MFNSSIKYQKHTRLGNCDSEIKQQKPMVCFDCNFCSFFLIFSCTISLHSSHAIQKVKPILKHWVDWCPAKACTGQSTTAGNRNGVKGKKRENEICLVGGCAGCDDVVWSLRAWGVASPLTPFFPLPWSPHTISVCRTSKDGSSPSCSPPSSSSPMWQLWRERRWTGQRTNTTSHGHILF